jgi:hypothetical protein
MRRDCAAVLAGIGNAGIEEELMPQYQVAGEARRQHIGEPARELVGSGVSMVSVSSIPTSITCDARAAGTRRQH